MFLNNQTEHYTELYKKLGYSFNNKELLIQALTRATAILEGTQKNIGDYQRLEFFGDKVIGLAISSILFTQYPNYKEGTLTQICSQFTSNNTLSKLAQYLNLGDYLILGKSDESNNVRNNKKVLADVVESLFGAIFVDSKKNYELIEKLISQHWQVLGLELPEDNLKEEKNVYLPEDKLDKELINKIISGTAQEVEFYLEKGAKPNVVHEVQYLSSGYLRSVLQLAITANQEKYKKMKILLKYGAKPDWQEGYSLISTASLPRKVELNVLLSTFFNSEKEKYFNKYTALHIVVKSFIEHTITADEACKMINLLVEYKANPNAVDAKGKTPLQLLIYLNKQSEEELEDEDNVKNLLQSISITKEPTSEEKKNQDFINEVEENFLSTAFSDINFGNI